MKKYLLLIILVSSDRIPKMCAITGILEMLEISIIQVLPYKQY